MRHLVKYSAFAAAATAFMFTAAPANADPKHCPPGHAKKGWCSPHHDRYDKRDRHDRYDRYEDRRDEARAYRDGYREGRRDAIRYNGRTYTDYRVIDDYGRYGLNRPPNGYYYAEVDGDIMMVQLATQLVTQLFSR